VSSAGPVKVIAARVPASEAFSSYKQDFKFRAVQSELVAISQNFDL
jgi:hypothetical protein